MGNTFIISKRTVNSLERSLFLRFLLKEKILDEFFSGVMSNDYHHKERSFAHLHPIKTATDGIDLAFPWENMERIDWSDLSIRWKDFLLDYRDDKRRVARVLKYKMLLYKQR